MRKLFVLTAAAAIALTACATAPHTVATRVPAGVPSAVVSALAPTGALRVALPANPPLFDHIDPATNEHVGIGLALAKALAAKLGVRYTIVSYPSPDAVAASATSGAWDVGITAVTPSATTALDLSAPFLLLPHTFLVRSGSTIMTADQADRAGVRIASEGGSPHTQKLQATLKHATVVLVAGDAAGIAMVRSGAADAYAGARAAFDQVVKNTKSLRIVTGDFFVPAFALGTPMEKDAGALAFLKGFVETVKASGALQQAITAAGLQDVDVAPAA